MKARTFIFAAAMAIIGPILCNGAFDWFLYVTGLVLSGLVGIWSGEDIYG